jgi:hypothetical protein
MQKPSVGRIVHFYQQNTDENPIPALVIGVYDDSGKVDLTVFGRSRFAEPTTMPGIDVPYSEAPKKGHWSWPPRV